MAIAENAPLIRYLRQYGSAPTDEITIHGETYWSDDQLEELLNRRGYWLTVAVEEVRDDLFVLCSPRHYFAQPTTIILLDSSGNELTGVLIDPPLTGLVDGEFTYDPIKGEIETTVSVMYIKAFFANMFEALSDLWELKASHRYDYIAVKAGANRMELDTEYKHCVSRMEYYRNKIIRRHERKSGRWVT